jgi:hypothetical protein
MEESSSEESSSEENSNKMQIDEDPSKKTGEPKPVIPSTHVKRPERASTAESETGEGKGSKKKPEEIK